MAAYRFSAKVIGRSAGRSSVAAAAYRAGSYLTDERTGQAHDYRRRGGIVHAEILMPEDAPSWMADREQLWNAVERVERRKDAQLAREVQFNLPHELSEEQRYALIRDFADREFVSRGMIADLAIHRPVGRDDERNHHAHIMLTMRALTEEGFGKKDRTWNDSGLLEAWRERWAEAQNRALEQAGIAARVDHRSYEDRGLDREPEPKMGPIATQMELQGKPSKAGDDRRAAKERNAAREERERQSNIIDARMVLEARRVAAETERLRQRHAAELAKSRKLASERANASDANYEAQLASLNLQLDLLRREQDGRSLWSRAWVALSGRAAKERAEADAMRERLEEIERQRLDAQAALQRAQDMRDAALKAQQDRERDRLEALQRQRSQDVTKEQDNALNEKFERAKKEEADQKARAARDQLRDELRQRFNDQAQDTPSKDHGNDYDL
ncbi:MAG: MobQ family relaxase [Pseudomonadota bacterium]